MTNPLDIKSHSKFQECCAAYEETEDEGERVALETEAHKLMKEYDIDPNEVDDECLYDPAGPNFGENELLTKLREDANSVNGVCIETDTKGTETLDDDDEEIKDDDEGDLLSEDEDDGPYLPHWEVEPWNDPVDGNKLIDELTEQIRKYVVLTEEQNTAVAFFVLQTWCHEKGAIYSPILAAVSPEPDSGKSTLLSLITYLACRGTREAMSSPSHMFHLMDEHKPTYILDEADKSLPYDRNLRIIFNKGWTDDDGIGRVYKGKTKNFKTFCPKVIGMKGLNIIKDSTTLTRFIFISCRPKLAGDVIDYFKNRDNDLFKVLRRKCLRWAEDHASSFIDMDPVKPEGFHNRKGSNWDLMFNIADRLGGEWPELLRGVAVELEKARNESENSISPGIRLLKAIKNIVLEFEDLNGACHFIESKALAEELLKLPDGEFSQYVGWGNEETKILKMQTYVAKLLKEYSTGHGDVIHTRIKRLKDDKVKRGYFVDDFQDTFERYCGGRVGLG